MSFNALNYILNTNGIADLINSVLSYFRLATIIHFILLLTIVGENLTYELSTLKIRVAQVSCSSGKGC